MKHWIKKHRFILTVFALWVASVYALIYLVAQSKPFKALDKWIDDKASEVLEDA